EKERDLSREPLFQVMFSMERAQQTDGGAEETTADFLSAWEESDVAAKFDITVTMVEERRGLRGYVEYKKELFDGETIRRMTEHMRRVAEEGGRDGNQRIWEIEMLTEGERERLLKEWNGTAREYEGGKSLVEVFVEPERERPEGGGGGRA